MDGADSRDLVLVSIFSGVGEEAFFRGAVLQEFGLVISSLLFGLAHIGPDRRYLVWTVWAVLAGFVFGALSRGQRRPARPSCRPRGAQRRDAPALEALPQGPRESRRSLKVVP